MTWYLSEPAAPVELLCSGPPFRRNSLQGPWLSNHNWLDKGLTAYTRNNPFVLVIKLLWEDLFWTYDEMWCRLGVHKGSTVSLPVITLLQHSSERVTKDTRLLSLQVSILTTLSQKTAFQNFNKTSMPYNHSGSQTIPDQAEINRNALRNLHQSLEAGKAQLQALFPTSQPGEVRRYTMPAEMILDGHMVRTTTSLIVRAPDVSPDHTPDIIETVHLSTVLRVNAKKIDKHPEQASTGLDEEKSILDSMVCFRDVPYLEISMANLLHWLGAEPVEFAHLEYTQPCMEFDNLQCFVDWAQVMLDSLYEEASDSNSDGEPSLRAASIEEEEDSDTSSTRSASSSRSWITVSMDESQNQSALVDTESAVEADTLPQHSEMLDLDRLPIRWPT